MPRTKQTARKTTGKHLEFTSVLNVHGSPNIPGVPYVRAPPAESKLKPKPKRVLEHRPTAPSSGPSSSRPKPSPKSILKKYPTVAVSLPASVPAPVAPERAEPRPPSRPDVPLSTNGAFANGTPPASGALIRRRPAVGVLDMPISVCTRFATWLENQGCVHDETLLRAVERDGHRLLCLAKATVTFENALRGNVPSVNGAVSPLMEHARTLRVFAEILNVKIAEGSLSEELETAVLRDGEALLRLAICCLEFDQTIRGSGSAQVK